jgi:hypothetical protein
MSVPDLDPQIMTALRKAQEAGAQPVLGDPLAPAIVKRAKSDRPGRRSQLGQHLVH